MIIPNIEEECSVENFSPDLNKEKLNLSFSYSDNQNGQESENTLAKELKGTKSDPAQAKVGKARARLESIDKPVLGFNFQESEYVETALIGEMESPNNHKIPNKFITLKPIIGNYEETGNKINEESEASSDIENMNKISDQIFKFNNLAKESDTPPKKIANTKSLPNIKDFLEAQGVDPQKIEEISRESDDDVPIATNDF